MSKPQLTLCRLLPTFSHFGRCWRSLRRTSSRRTLEIALAAIYVGQILRLMQALTWIPSFPTLSGSGGSDAVRLVVASDQFYAHIWPSPVFWIAVMGAGALMTIAGMQQTVAAINVMAHGRNPLLLSGSGEDDPNFLTSVDAEWLLWDIRLRRLGMTIGMGFFATLGWNLLVHTGYASLTYIVLLFICTFVDNRLWETGLKLDELVEARRRAEKEAFQAVALGQITRL